MGSGVLQRDGITDFPLVTEHKVRANVFCSHLKGFILMLG